MIEQVEQMVDHDEHAEVLEDLTVRQARLYLSDAMDEGTTCPCCTQKVKSYQRSVHSSMALALWKIWIQQGTSFGYVCNKLTHHENADWAKLAYWGLIEEEERVRPDGGRAGFWRVTGTGERWIRDAAFTLPKHIRVFNKVAVTEPYGEPTTFKQALGKKFNLMEMMRA